MENRKQATEIKTGVAERRYSADCEVRAKGEGRTITGYAAVFDSIYDMGWFTEEVDRRAFAATNKGDARALFNHDVNVVLGRTKVGTARVFVDDKGLYYEADLPNTTAANDVLELVRSGNVDQSSWGFILREGGDKWEVRGGKKHRILTDVSELLDVSVVTFPANPDTSVAKRSFDAYSQPVEEPAEQSEQREKNEQINTELQVSIALLERQLDYLNSTT